MFSRSRPNVSIVEYAVRIFRLDCYVGIFVFFLLQQRLRDERENKRANLDERHRHLFDIIATRLGIERSEVEDNVLDSPNVSLFILHSMIQKFDFSLISWINFLSMREVNILFSSIKNPNQKIIKMEVVFPKYVRCIHYLNFFQLNLIVLVYLHMQIVQV